LFGKEADVFVDDDFQLLLLSTATLALASGVVSPILDSLTGVFGVSPSRIGLMVSVINAPGIVVIPIVGLIADGYGRRKILFLSLALFGVAGTAIAFTTDFRVVLGLRLLQGFSMAGIGPVIITSIGDLYEDPAEATAQGLRMTAVALASVVIPIIAGTLVVVSWQYPFLLYVVAVPVAIMVYLWFDEPMSDPPYTSDDSDERDDSPELRNLMNLITRWEVAPMLFARTIPTFAWILFVTYNSIIVVRLLGGTPQEAGLLVALSGLITAIASSQVGRITGLFSTRFVPMIIAHVTIAVGYTLVAFASSFPIAMVAVFVGGTGNGIAAAMYRSIITGLAPPDLRGSLVSIGESSGFLAATIAPIMLGFVVDAMSPSFGFGPALRWAMLGTNGLLFVAAVGALTVASPALTSA